MWGIGHKFLFKVMAPPIDQVMKESNSANYYTYQLVHAISHLIRSIPGTFLFLMDN